jgi:hypothetical protein
MNRSVDEAHEVAADAPIFIEVEAWRPASWLHRHCMAGGRSLVRRLEMYRP